MMISLLSAKTCASFSYVLQQQLQHVTRVPENKGQSSYFEDTHQFFMWRLFLSNVNDGRTGIKINPILPTNTGYYQGSRFDCIKGSP